MSKPLIFISCGQFTEEEKATGQKVASLLQELGYEAYFAQNQVGLEALNLNIFKNLDRCAGFIAIMEDRGRIKDSNDGTDHGLRASVWIEQEIAIASFINSIREEKLLVRFYQRGNLKREGVRQLIMDNAIPFTNVEDILADIKNEEKNWNLKLNLAVALDLVIKAQKERINPQITPKQWGVDFCFSVKNCSQQKITHFAFEILLPKNILQSPPPDIPGASPTHSKFIVEQLDVQGPAILPGRSHELLSRACMFADNYNTHTLAEIFAEPIRAKFSTDTFSQKEVLFRVNAEDIKSTVLQLTKDAMPPGVVEVLTISGEIVA